MSSSSRLPIGVIDAALDEVLAVEPIFLTTVEKQDALRDLSRVIARAEAARMRVLVAADDVAEVTGDRSTADWLAGETRDTPGTVRRLGALAASLGSRWTLTAAAMAAGGVNLAQARVIAEALDDLPGDLAEVLRAKAETYLVAQAAELGPRELRTLGRGVLEHLAPDLADEHEYQRLLAEEERARAQTRLSLRPRSDGSTDLHARIPDHAAHRLQAYLNAFTAPRRRHLADGQTDEVADLPIARQRGDAFVALLENLPTQHLPRHGGTATSVMVILDYDTLLSGVGVATTSTGDRVTAGQARRLACQAGIIPFVLGGDSEILDEGRRKRLVTDAIRKALNLRDRGCTTAGCSMPAEFCEAHHIVPWSRGGKTGLQDCKLLCPWHHHRAHDPAWQVHHHPNGSTTFHRRT